MLNLDLQGKVAVVTGASGELGRVISRTLADCGARVALHYYRGQERAEAEWVWAVLPKRLEHQWGLFSPNFVLKD